MVVFIHRTGQLRAFALVKLDGYRRDVAFILSFSLGRQCVVWNLSPRDLFAPTFIHLLPALVKFVHPLFELFDLLTSLLKVSLGWEISHRSVAVGNLFLDPLDVTRGCGAKLVGDSAHVVKGDVEVRAWFAFFSVWVLRAVLGSDPDGLVELLHHVSCRRSGLEGRHDIARYFADLQIRWGRDVSILEHARLFGLLFLLVLQWVLPLSDRDSVWKHNVLRRACFIFKWWHESG